SVTVRAGTNNGIFRLAMPMIPADAAPGSTIARFRLSSDAAAADPTGLALGGEVEDYRATITLVSGATVDRAKTQKITNAEVPLANYDRFGAATASLGDLDGDGVNDLAVGAISDDTNGYSTGAVYVLFLRSDGTVKSQVKIASDTAGGPTL